MDIDYSQPDPPTTLYSDGTNLEPVNILYGGSELRNEVQRHVGNVFSSNITANKKTRIAPGLKNKHPLLN